jgi:hypothetical protein
MPHLLSAFIVIALGIAGILCVWWPKAQRGSDWRTK